jgi:hypothetical protein
MSFDPPFPGLATLAFESTRAVASPASRRRLAHCHNVRENNSHEANPDRTNVRRVREIAAKVGNRIE